MLDSAFEALQKYDWGTEISPLAPIEDAVASTYGKPEERKDLENRLVAALQATMSRDALDYVCRKLAVVGSDACVAALKPRLLDKGHSHMARFALERIQSAEAAKALRDSVAAAPDELKVGIISSIGSRRDAEAVGLLSSLTSHSNSMVARAAIQALGTVGTTAAAEALKSAWKNSGANSTHAVDAMLDCAERLLASQHRQDAQAIYKQFAEESQPRYVRLAATRGLLACANG